MYLKSNIYNIQILKYTHISINKIRLFCNLIFFFRQLSPVIFFHLIQNKTMSKVSNSSHDVSFPRNTLGRWHQGKGFQILPNLQANKLDCHGFVDAGSRPKTPGSDTHGTVSRVNITFSFLSLVTKFQGVGGMTRRELDGKCSRSVFASN